MQQQPQYGPRVDVENGVGSVAVLRAYGGASRAPVLWRGMVTIFYGTDAKFDIEVSLLESKDGSGTYVGWPQRAYDANGTTKYKNVVWCHDRALAAATAQAIEAFMSQGYR